LQAVQCHAVCSSSLQPHLASVILPALAIIAAVAARAGLLILLPVALLIVIVPLQSTTPSASGCCQLAFLHIHRSQCTAPDASNCLPAGCSRLLSQVTCAASAAQHAAASNEAASHVIVLCLSGRVFLLPLRNVLLIGLLIIALRIDWLTGGGCSTPVRGPQRHLRRLQCK
jgi:hypothetical protein